MKCSRAENRTETVGGRTVRVVTGSVRQGEKDADEVNDGEADAVLERLDQTEGIRKTETIIYFTQTSCFKELT